MADPRDAQPVACTLTESEGVTQRERWLRLAAASFVGRTATATGLRLVFRAGGGVEDELQALVAVERACCAWAEWEVRRAADDLVLEIRSTGEGVATLHGMFTALAAGGALS
jgi:hypothetical protein